MGLNNLKKEKEQGEILVLFLLHDIKNNYNKTLEKILTNQTRKGNTPTDYLKPLRRKTK